jgi:hypothetical protein
MTGKSGRGLDQREGFVLFWLLERRNPIEGMRRRKKDRKDDFLSIGEKRREEERRRRKRKIIMPGGCEVHKSDD